MNKKIKLIAGIILTMFNLGVFIFTQSHISPKYFEVLFAIYFIISFIVGIKLISKNWFAFSEEGE